MTSGFSLVYQALAVGGERGSAAVRAWGLSQHDGSPEFAAACGDPGARPELARRALDG